MRSLPCGDDDEADDVEGIRAVREVDAASVVPGRHGPEVQTARPKVGENGGRPPIPLEWMSRVYMLQLWLNLSDPAMQKELYDSVAMHTFVGIDLGVEVALDGATVYKFRHLLERNKLGKVRRRR
jgi:hypothetical protein